MSSPETKTTLSKIVCTKCNSKKGISKDRLAKLVAQFGSLAELIAKYVCRSCRKEHKVRRDGRIKPPKKIRKTRMGTLPQELRNLPPVEHKPPMTFAEIKEYIQASKTCIRPDIWSNNGKACDGCVYYPCGCECKIRDKIKHRHLLKAQHATKPIVV